MRPAIHQFVSRLVDRDAIGKHVLAIRDLLLSRGVESTIYVDNVSRDLRGRAHHFREFDSARSGSAILYHLGTGSHVADYCAARPEPLVIDYHNITPAEYFLPWEPLQAGALKVGRRRLADLATRTTIGIADSAFNAQELVDLGYRRTAVVPILMDLSMRHTEADPTTLARLADAKRRGGSDWLFVGRIAPNKAQHDLIKAFAMHARLFGGRGRLHLVGSSSSSRYESMLRNLVKVLKVDQQVEFAGSVDEAVLTAYFRTADVFVCASDHEGFCVPVVEAMHCGVPVIGYDAAAVADTIGQAGLCLSVKRPLEVAVAVERVLTDRDLNAALIAAGRQRAKQLDLPTTGLLLFSSLEPLLG